MLQQDAERSGTGAEAEVDDVATLEFVCRGFQTARQAKHFSGPEIRRAVTETDIADFQAYMRFYL